MSGGFASELTKVRLEGGRGRKIEAVLTYNDR